VLHWPGIDSIVIYATAPRKEVIGEAVIEEVIEDDIANVWHLTKKAVGITHDFFRAYYKGKKKAVAYKLGELELFEKPKRLEDYGIRCAPQSFVYVAHSPTSKHISVWLVGVSHTNAKTKRSQRGLKEHPSRAGGGAFASSLLIILPGDADHGALYDDEAECHIRSSFGVFPQKKPIWLRSSPWPVATAFGVSITMMSPLRAIPSARRASFEG
jgi:predicted transcriptional regulator